MNRTLQTHRESIEPVKQTPFEMSRVIFHPDGTVEMNDVKAKPEKPDTVTLLNALMPEF